MKPVDLDETSKPNAISSLRIQKFARHLKRLGLLSNLHDNLFVPKTNSKNYFMFLLLLAVERWMIRAIYRFVVVENKRIGYNDDGRWCWRQNIKFEKMKKKKSNQIVNSAITMRWDIHVGYLHTHKSALQTLLVDGMTNKLFKIFTIHSSHNK